MKPPRVFAKAGYFWISYYVPGEKNDIRNSTHLSLDIPAGTGAWWRKSKHAKRIQQVIKALEEERYAKIMGYHWNAKEEPEDLTFHELLTQYNEDTTALRGVPSKQTLRRREHSVSQAIAFKNKDVNIVTIDIQWISKFRSWMKAKGFKDWTQHTILTDLKKMFAFAKKKKYISDNPFEDIRNPQPETLKLHTSIEDEFAFFRALYHINKKYFLMMLTERLAGFRFSDNQAMTRDMIDLKKKLFVKVRNVKGKREEMFPISDALALAFEKVWEPYEKFAFPQVTIQAVNKAIKDACKEAGIKQLASHQFKSNYAHEIEEQETYRHIFKMLMHHKDQDVSARYTGKNIELMRKVLNRSQERWMKLVVGL